ncbi:dihydroneopterin aldolase [Chachezhania sediminis]|uniref:dihydroneopterin aldolase n=1 Tax=Chachezhania sediminis TaxID=2599291 RepID=UPI00131AAD5E|nr:dihydroneopterin aldolase [Chachezhania sediminis]
MSDDVKLAFAHPSQRAAAMAAPGPHDQGPLDRISLRDHVVEVEIGAFQAERGTRQRISFDIAVEVRPVAAPVDDDVDRILSYDKIAEAIAHELEAERLNLLETLAERVADRILLEPQAMRVFVRIQKLDRGPGALGVEIVRARSAEPHGPVHETDIAPRIVFLSNAAIASGHLGHWIDRLEAEAAPTILCVGRAGILRPETGHVMTQRRIDLLAIEQNAWVLASRDPRCVVVATRTELDWAMKHGQISVWAPSKIVLDAVNGPPKTLPDDLSLVTWFASTYGVTEVLAIGADAVDSAGDGVAVTSRPAGADAV